MNMTVTHLQKENTHLEEEGLHDEHDGDPSVEGDLLQVLPLPPGPVVQGCTPRVQREGHQGAVAGVGVVVHLAHPAVGVDVVLVSLRTGRYISFQGPECGYLREFFFFFFCFFFQVAYAESPRYKANAEKLAEKEDRLASANLKYIKVNLNLVTREV